MSNNGTDRDVALSIVTMLNTLAGNIEQINDNLYVPHIVTQPTDQEADINESITFSVVANNVKAYQWQYQVVGQSVWTDSTTADATTSSRTMTVASASYYQNRFRCKITGLDNSVIYTNVVKIVAPSNG